MKKVIICCGLMIAALSLHAQTTTDLLKETSQAYLDAKNLSMDVIVTTFATQNDAGSLMGKGLIRKSGESYYSKFLSDELIVNKNCTVVLDHAEKTVCWYGSEKKKNRKDRSGELPSMDSLLAYGDSVVYAGTENGLRHFLFYSKYSDASIPLTEVFIDEMSHFVTKIVYYYSENTTEDAYDMYKIVIEYTNISTAAPDPSFFSEKKYLIYNKDVPALTPAYSAYELIIP